jgi:hypothetical protein
VAVELIWRERQPEVELGFVGVRNAAIDRVIAYDLEGGSEFDFESPRPLPYAQISNTASGLAHACSPPKRARTFSER